MAAVTPRRTELDEEFVDFKSGISEQLLTLIAANQNFVFTRAQMRHSFNFNGPYSTGVGITTFDGVFMVDVPLQILYVNVFSRVSGTSGDSSLSLTWIDNGSNQGDVFSVRPSVNFNSPNDAYILQDVVNNSTIYTSSNITAPVMTRTTFPAGSVLKCGLEGAMSQAEDLAMEIVYIHINADEVAP